VEFETFQAHILEILTISFPEREGLGDKMGEWWEGAKRILRKGTKCCGLEGVWAQDIGLIFLKRLQEEGMGAGCD
jgi:hypothetical protein